MKIRDALTIGMFVWEPVVLRILIFEIRIPLLALLLSEIFIIFRTILYAAKLELIAWSKTCTTSISWAKKKIKLYWQVTSHD